MESTTEYVQDGIYTLEVKQHLVKVYGCVGLSFLMTTIAAWIGVTFPALGFSSVSWVSILTILASLTTLIVLIAAHFGRANIKLRLGLMVAFAIFSGFELVPLLTEAININPMIILAALLGAVVIFLSLLVAALIAPQRSFLYLLGPIGSMLSYMIILIFLSFLHPVIFTAVIGICLWLGLLVSCLFVLYDTQNIIEQRLKGDTDYVFHSVMLFIDLLDLFRYLLMILIKNEKSNNNQTE